MRRLFFVVGFFIFSSLFFLMTADLVGAKEFALFPSAQEVLLKPGANTSRQITVVNNLDQAALFKVTIADVGQANNATQVSLLADKDSAPYSLKPYVNLPETSFNLLPGQKKTLTVNINLPVDVPVLGAYGAIIISTTDLDLTGQTKTVSQLGSILLIKVDAPAKEVGQLVGFTAGGRLIHFSTEPLILALSFANTGNVHLNPYGVIGVTNIFGREVAAEAVEPWFVLPGATRLREVTLTKKLGAGYYRAHLALNRGYGDVIDKRAVSLVIMPSMLMSGVWLLVFAIGFYWLVIKWKK